MIFHNPSGGKDLIIYFDDELTMSFDRFHAHYAYVEEEELRNDIEGIMSGKYAATCIESNGNWLGSGLAIPEEIPLDSRKKLLKYLIISWGCRKMQLQFCNSPFL